MLARLRWKHSIEISLPRAARRKFRRACEVPWPLVCAAACLPAFAGFFAAGGFASAASPRLFFSAAIRSMTLLRSGSAGSLTSMPSPFSLASIIARSRVS